ncbi:hemerythrin domain-containing protein [uncultured Desulfosarcina sp.]|uniref:hemerythrin domain-containing protein n=1 Tax=uncultured Desulfosarcina sp. TaxID=218289 RepID=UPI0029C8C4C1|nr:hemerythrin domain-containing protein [uncultured Desulfosarcina sp.]
MNAIEDLREEHEAVRLTLRILDKIIVETSKAGRVPRPGDMDQLLDFFSIFVDTCHHGKEEEQLFPAMEAVGVSRDGGPIGVMLKEHEEGRGHVKAMRAALKRSHEGTTGAVDDLIRHARAYIQMLEQHIQKENRVLFPMAIRHLSTAKLNELNDGFEKIETDKIGTGRHEAFHRMLDSMKSVYLLKKGGLHDH